MEGLLRSLPKVREIIGVCPGGRGAVARNPISILIPCHRVVGANGSLTGYAGGIGRKIQLLTLEKVDVDQFLSPKKV